MVEFAMALPVFFMLLFVSLQLALIGVQYYSTIHVARDTTRWAAIHPDTVDSGIVAHALAIDLPGVGASGISSVTVSPSCTQLVSGHCSNRTPGEPISVTVSPNLSTVLFIPTTFTLGGLQAALPSSLPPYRVAMVVE